MQELALEMTRGNGRATRHWTRDEGGFRDEEPRTRSVACSAGLFGNGELWLAVAGCLAPSMLAAISATLL